MTDYLAEAPRGEHASNLGAFIAQRFADLSGCRAFIVDPVSVDELTEVARISGAPEIKRPSLVHALNQKAVARNAAAELGKKYEECRLSVAHLGTDNDRPTGGKIVDAVGAKADGPFLSGLADFRSGTGRTIFSGIHTEAELRKTSLDGACGISWDKDIREAVIWLSMTPMRNWS